MRYLFTAIFVLLSSPFSFANAESLDCFLVKEGGNYLVQEGKNCDVRYSPASTFKIALAVIGYDSKILKDENHPIWQSPKSLTFLQDYWAGEKSPTSWMRFSIVWYSQELTKKLGAKKFQNYVDNFDYGNRDLSGNPGLNDGLTESWLSSSLLISPNEQISFIEKLAKNQLPVSQKAQIKAKNILRLFEESQMSNGWTLYGKTGSPVDRITGDRAGYFVGFATKNERLISFVVHISGDKNSNVKGIKSKKLALDKMLKGILSE